MFASLHTHIADPVERIKAIADANSVAKQHSSAISATLLRIGHKFAAPAVFGLAMRAYARTRLTKSRPVHNLVVSNVPGPQVPLYFLGSEVTAMYPAGTGLPRLGTEHHRDVAERQTGRRDRRVSGAGAGPVGAGRRLRGSEWKNCCSRHGRRSGPEALR